ncbi:MAG: DUF1697 domain-containing protein [Rhodobacteraceae bacterium]|nr:DUF1697 domain-containing protein [Paracoccaceae bacterium]
MSDEPCILFLRGVNVGAHRKLPMAELRALLGGLGLADVKTHIQSGNAVFRDPEGRADLAAAITSAIGDAFPFTPDAMLLRLSDLDAVLAANPYAVEGRRDGARVHLGFLGRPSAADPRTLDALATDRERWTLTDAAFYLHLPDGLGSSKLATQAERVLKVPMTLRNQRVAEAVADLARAL